MIKRLSAKFKEDKDTGFGNSSNNQGSRLVNTDGSYNVKLHGLPLFRRLNIYHELITMPWWKFGLIVFFGYFIMNTFFAAVFMTVGMEEIEGDRGISFWEHFADAYFFSSQTLTTVGYGRQNPIGLAANIVAAVECLVGLMSFALMTGLLYGRFSRPKAMLNFSKNMVIAPYANGEGLMFRIANTRSNQLIECEAQVLLSVSIDEGNRSQRKFIPLKLERNKINSLALSWTIVHPIDDESPLSSYTIEELAENDGEFIFNFKAFDEVYSQTVHTRSSYRIHDIVQGARFVNMYRKHPNGKATILDHDLINAHEKINPHEQTAASAK